MDISKLEKSKVLAALFNAAKPLGMGIFHFKPEHIMDEEEAAQLLAEHTYFDYLEGRLMKVNLAPDILDTRAYNRDNGENAAENAIVSALFPISIHACYYQNPCIHAAASGRLAGMQGYRHTRLFAGVAVRFKNNNMDISFGDRVAEFGPGVLVELTGEEVATAIYAYLAAHNVFTEGPITIRVNDEAIEGGSVYVDPSGKVVANGDGWSGRGNKF